MHYLKIQVETLTYTICLCDALRTDLDEHNIGLKSDYDCNSKHTYMGPSPAGNRQPYFGVSIFRIRLDV